MIQSSFSTTRPALRQTGSLVPLTPAYYPVNLGRGWTYHCVSRQWAGAVLADETLSIENERVDGISPAGDEGWTVSLRHDVTLSDRTHDHFTSQIQVSATAAHEQGSLPFLTNRTSWDGVSPDGLTVYRYTTSAGVATETLAGTFDDCLLVVEEAIRNGDLLYRKQDWYAAEIGRVRSEFVRESSLGRFVETRELARYDAE